VSPGRNTDGFKRLLGSSHDDRRTSARASATTTWVPRLPACRFPPACGSIQLRLVEQADALLFRSGRPRSGSCRCSPVLSRVPKRFSSRQRSASAHPETALGSPHRKQQHRKPRASRSPIKSSGAGYYTAAGRTREMHGVGGGWAHGLSWGPCNRPRPEPGPSLRYICGAARAVRRRQHLWIQRHCWDPSIPPRQGEHVCEPNHQQICPERLLGSSHDGP
jgi:hypothetical protein